MIWRVLGNFVRTLTPLISFKEKAAKGWKSGARSLSWKTEWNPCTLATYRRWTYPKTFFRFRERVAWTQMWYRRFHDLSNLIFHTHNYNGAEEQCICICICILITWEFWYREVVGQSDLDRQVYTVAPLGSCCIETPYRGRGCLCTVLYVPFSISYVL